MSNKQSKFVEFFFRCDGKSILKAAVKERNDSCSNAAPTIVTIYFYRMSRSQFHRKMSRLLKRYIKQIAILRFMLMSTLCYSTPFCL